VAFAASFVGLAYGIALLAGLFFAPDALTTEEGPLWMSLLQNTVLMSYAGVPVAAGIAILRHRLYDIDVIINRALVYAALTASLAAVYLVSVVGLQRLLSPLVGEGNQLSVVASTLLIAALFRPLRRRVQGFIDRRFYRKKYDARKTLEEFGDRLRGGTELENLVNELVEVVHDTMRPTRVSLWLRESERSPGGGPE
jgi:hypothetical protein